MLISKLLKSCGESPKKVVNKKIKKHEVFLLQYTVLIFAKYLLTTFLCEFVQLFQRNPCQIQRCILLVHFCCKNRTYYPFL
jgi:hypothetical protein